MGKYQIFLSTFGKKVLRMSNAVPIEVGAVFRTGGGYTTRDDQGDNISRENPFYGELTGIYWVWKNTDFAPDDIVGFGHYNKAISISKKVAQKWLKTNPSGFITIKPSQIRNHPIEKEAIAMITGVKRSGIKYSEAWDKLYNPDASAKYDCCRGGNMFITTAEQFQKYCDWLFPILAFMRSEIGDKLDSSPYWKRYCAYAGERLLSVYIEANSLPVKSCNVKYKKWWLPICRKIIQAFHLSKNSLFYKKLKRRFGYSSQYKI